MTRFMVVLVSMLQLVMLSSLKAVTSSAAAVAKVDTHCHFIPDWYKHFYKSRHVAAGLHIPEWNVNDHLDFNAKFGVSTCVLSAGTPGAKFSKDDPIEEGRMLARKLNDYAYNLTVEHPTKFLFFGTLTLPDLEGSVDEAIYSLDTLKAAGITVAASEFGEVFGTPRLAPLYQVLNDRNAVVFIHPNLSPCPDYAPGGVMPENALPPFVVDFLLDTTRAATNLVFRNVTRDYPNIKFLLAHSGGFLPFVAHRAADGLALLSHDFSRASEYYEEFTKFYVDLALSISPTPLTVTSAFFDHTRLTFGSDYPMAPAPLLQRYMESFMTYEGLHSDAKRLVASGNAYNLFRKSYDRMESDVDLCNPVEQM